MGIISVREYGCAVYVFSPNPERREALQQELFPENRAGVEISYDPECNTLDVRIFLSGDDDSSIEVAIPPDPMVLKLLSTFVEINDRPLSEVFGPTKE